MFLVTDEHANTFAVFRAEAVTEYLRTQPEATRVYELDEAGETDYSGYTPRDLWIRYDRTNEDRG